MRIGLVDVDGHNFPNLALMKLSAFHKRNGDEVSWADKSTMYDRVYMSKVFTFTPDDSGYHAFEVVKGGTGYGLDTRLPYEVEHQYPDYELYGITDTAYGYTTRGCPRNCDFCIVGKKEGAKSVKVAEVSEFWRGQKYIKLLDPNLLACKEREEILRQLAETRAYIDYTQGLDIRFVTDRIAELINATRYEGLHFAWDSIDDRVCERKLEQFSGVFRRSRNGLVVYTLTNFDSTHEQDMYRVNKLISLGYYPYIMIYDKQNAPAITRKLQRWCNNRRIFKTVTFEEYLKTGGKRNGKRN